jgi:tetratricopeptide (TPR) repeat protein
MWKIIVEANLEELLALKISSKFDADFNQSMRLLLEGLVAYYKNDNGLLLELYAELECLQEPELRLITKLRIMIRQKSIDIVEIESIVRDSSLLNFNAILLAEIYFLSAVAAQSIKRFDLSQSYFLMASNLFESQHCYKKSVRALFNHVSAFSCLKPNSKLFVEYNLLYKKALQAQEYSTAAASLVNISREFQLLGANDVAVDYAKQASNLLNEKLFGSREHGLALVHLAQLYFQIERNIEALKCFQFALNISHSEVQSACSVLSEKYNLNFKTLTNKCTTPSWDERIAEKKTSKSLGRLEAIILFCLSTGPKTKHELILELYPDDMDFEFKENRFKNLLNRLRNKFKDMIIFENGKYILIDKDSFGILPG